MDKKLFLAIGLSLLVLISWQMLLPKPQPIVQQEVTSTKLSSQPATPIVQAAAISQPANSIKDPVKFIQPKRTIVFNPAEADIFEVIFTDKVEHRLKLVNGFSAGENLLFKQHSLTEDSISFVYEDQARRIVKKFTFPKDSYTLDLEIQVKNLSKEAIALNSQLVLGRLNLSGPRAQYQDVFLGGKEKSLHLAAGKEYNQQEIKFIGLRDQYFCAIVEPKSLTTSGYVRKINPKESEVGLLITGQSIKPNEQIGHFYKIYLGPQDLKVLNSINPDWTAIIHFGTFDIVAQVLLQLLGFIYGLVHSWGWAIIILSVIVYLLLFPLTLKQMRSMKEMQVLQPKIEALRTEFKNNPQRLNKEIMELYKEHKVNPLGGCLPLLLQMPIFFALYQALIRSNALRGAQFLWIQDLSSPDKLPLFGTHINILPILMAIGMFVQQKLSMGKATGEAAQQQKIMSIIMPVMFGAIFYQMPSGLVLYWFINSLLMLFYQFRINRQK